jgi:type I restriction enzyme S subunit
MLSARHRFEDPSTVMLDAGGIIMIPEIKQRIEQIRRGEVPEGYKKTSVGIVPNDWKEYRLGDIYTERNEPGRNDLPILMVSIHSGVSDGEVDEEDMPKTVKRIEDKSAYKCANSGDLVFNMMRAWQGAIGTVRTDGMVSPAYIVAKPNETVDPLFMDDYMKSSRMTYSIFRQSYGVTDFRLRLYWDSFTPIECTIPPISEQRKIVEIVSACDKAIELKQKLVDELKKLKKVCLAKMFPQEGETVPEIRFPGFTVPWVQRKLNEVFSFLQNNTLSREVLSPEVGVAKDVHYGDILVKYNEYLDVTKEDLPYIQTEQVLERLREANLENGDVVMADTAEDETAGKCVEIAGVQDFPVISGLHTIPLRPKQQFASGYLGYYMNSSAYHSQLLPLMQGIKVTSVSKNSVQKTRIVFPGELPEQAAIGRFFIAIDTFLASYRNEIAETQKKKKVLLQLLLSGLVRVNT